MNPKKFWSLVVLSVFSLTMVGIVVSSSLQNIAQTNNFRSNFELEPSFDFNQEEIELLQPWITDRLKQLKEECDSAVQDKDSLLKNSHVGSSKEAAERLQLLNSYNKKISEGCEKYRDANDAAVYFKFRDLEGEGET